MRKSMLKRVVALGLAAVVVTSSLAGCTGNESNKKQEKATVQKEEANGFVDAVKAAMTVKSGEIKGSFTYSTPEVSEVSYDYDLLIDGNKALWGKLDSKTEDAGDLEFMLYDNKIYFMSGMGNILDEYEENTAFSIDVNTLVAHKGQLDAMTELVLTVLQNEDAGLGLKGVITDVLELCAKDMPSVFAKDVAINKDNAEKAAEEYSLFLSNDLRKIYDSFDSFATEYMPEYRTNYSYIFDDLFEEARSAESDNNLADENSGEKKYDFSNTDLKLTIDAKGEEGSRVFDFTLNTENSFITEQYRIDKISMSGQLEEKEVDIKSHVPEKSVSVDERLERMFVPCCEKPVIYLYPETDTEVNVSLGYEDKIIVSYPEYTNGWNVLAKTNGDLIDLKTGKDLYSLYYESKCVNDFSVEEDGFVVEGDKVADFLDEKLEILGLNYKEREEFIVYWLPRLQANKYNYIRFATFDEIEKNMPLNIAPAPDTLIRVMMIFKGMDEPVDVKEQKLERVERNGFTAVEWGGTEIK